MENQVKRAKTILKIVKAITITDAVLIIVNTILYFGGVLDIPEITYVLLSLLLIAVGIKNAQQDVIKKAAADKTE